MRFVLSLSVASALLFVVGCGKGGPARIDVKGTVTYHGKPVPAGQIVFDPDSKRGNQGPTGSARIQNGHFDTRDKGNAPIAGPHVARITGMDGVPGVEMPYGRILFGEWTVNIDVDRSKTEFEFDVPASASKKP
jgi:hypothetical protein